MKNRSLFAMRVCCAVMSLSLILSGCVQTDEPSSLPESVSSLEAESGFGGDPVSGPQGESAPQAQEPSALEAVDLFEGEFSFKKPKRPIPSAPNILFLGNSYTFANDLPAMFEALSWSGGFRADVYELTDGSYRLEYFADPEDELGAKVYEGLTQYDWDYVILQEQSRVPTIEAETMMYPAARTLDALIQNADGQTVFLMTWAYRDGDDLTGYGIRKKTTREEMQAELFMAYDTIARELDALLSPAGAAFIRFAKEHPEVELWDPEDGMHPTAAGSYLAACTLYATLYNESPVGLEYTAELEPETAQALQRCAADLVLGVTEEEPAETDSSDGLAA